MNFFKELKRRNVFKVGIAYAITTWILLQLTEIASGILELPAWAPKLILLILVVGFVPALILAWAFELTPQGLKLDSEVQHDSTTGKKSGRKLDYAIMILLGLALAYFIWESRFEQRSAEYEAALNQPPPVVAEAEAPPVRNVPPELADANRNSIAVLPFANRSADANDIYFTDGIHDDLLTQLSKIGAFSVISRTSVMEYRDTTKNLKDIARELDVANIMEGAVQRAGNRVRINVQLIDAESDEHLWAEIYDRELSTENLFDIQSEIARSIASALQATLTDAELATVGDVPTDNVAAYDLYLQGRQFSIGETRVGYQTALELYREALNLDPEFKLAWVGLADAHITNYWVYGGDPADRDMAREAIDRARAIDADFPELYMAEGFYWYWGHLDYERALYNLNRALEHMSGNDKAWMWHGWASRRAGLWNQALESMEHALRLNPRVSFNWTEYAGTLAYLHRFDEAREAYQKARELDPDSFWPKTGLGGLELSATGDAALAVRLSIGAQHAEEPNHFTAYIQARLADRRFDEALEAVRNMRAELEIQRQTINLREGLSALILSHSGRQEEARAAADAAWFRLQGLREQLGDDYRVSHAEAFMGPIRGDSPEQLRERVAHVEATRPADEVEGLRFRYEYASIFAMAGMVEDAVAQLEPEFEPPSEVTVHRIELDPAFDRIRERAEFLEMLGRHR